MEPYIFDENEDFAVVFKPPRMHCAPLKHSGGDTLLDWYAEVFPPVRELLGWKEGEGGLLHRLDFETRGLVLFAKNRQSLDHLMRQQDEGNCIKEYIAVCQRADTLPFSSPPPSFDLTQNNVPPPPFVIESFFRPYGPGRKQVRPVTGTGKGKELAADKGGFYRTVITGFSVESGGYVFTARLRRGFRHQIRCHLAWIGCPVLHDPLYGQGGGQHSADGFLGLEASGLMFTGPDGKSREYHIPPMPQGSA